MDKPKIRFQGFEEAWSQKTLGDFGSVAMNKRIFKNQTSDKGDIPFYKIGTFGKTPDSFISKKIFAEYKSKYPYPKIGDILISASGSVGKIVEYKGEDAYFQDSNIVWLDHKGRINNKFLKSFYSIVKWAGLEGSTIKRLYNSNILQTSIKLPSLPEQEKIGKLFERIDHLLNLQQRKCEKLKVIKKAMLSKMFPKPGKKVPEVRFQGFTDDWVECFVKDVCNIATGLSNTQDQTENGIYPFFIRSDKPLKSNKYLYDCEAVITIGDGNIGKVFHYINGKFDLHQRCYKMTDFKYIIGKYFFYYFSTHFYERVIKMSAKTTVDSVRIEMISDMKLLYPVDIKEQKLIAYFFHKLDSLIHLSESKLSKLRLIKGSLLEGMFV